MKNPNDLFRLIKSLLPTEKRYFKISSDLQSGPKSYLVVFDILEKQKVFSRKKLFNELIEQKIILNNEEDKFRATLSYTKTCILKALRGMAAKKNNELTIQSHLHNTEILFAKGLIKQSIYKISQAKKIALKYDLTLYRQQINRLELDLVHEYANQKTAERIKELYKEANELIELLHIETTYAKIYHELFVFYRNNGRQKANSPELSKIIEQFELDIFNETVAQKSFHTSYLYELIWAYYRLVSNQVVNAFDRFKNVIDIWQKNNVFINAYPERYRNLINNYLNLSLSLRRFDNGFFSYLTLLQEQKTTSAAQKAFNFQDVYFLKLRYALNAPQLEKCPALIAEIKNKLKRYRFFIPSSRKIAFYNNIISYFFLKEEYPKAAEWAAGLRNTMAKTEQRADLQARLKTFSLIFEYENYPRVDLHTRVASISRHLRYEKQLNKFTLIVLKNLIVFAEKQAAMRTEKIATLREFDAQIQTFKHQTGLSNISGLGVEEIELWVQSKIENKSIETIYLRRQATSNTDQSLVGAKTISKEQNLQELN